MSAGLDVDAGAKVAELRETIATIEALIAEKRRELLAARGALTLWNRVHVAVQAANNGAKRIGTGSGIDNVAIGNENRRLVLDLMGDGATRKVGEIAEAIDRLPGTIGGVVARLVKAGELERPTFSTYRLARKSASPPPSRPAPVPAAPVPAKDDDATLIPAALVSDIDLEPLRGAAPQARCPKCLANKSLVSWSHAIGLRNGRYVYRCPACRATFHTNTEDRPK